MTHLSIVLPCFNEEANIEAAVRDVGEFFTKENIDGEIIVVDDGSRDGSGEILRELQKTLHHVKILRHDQNQGYGLAIRTGLDAATKEIVGFMDSDGQFHAKDLQLLLEHIGEYDFVTGRRAKRADSFVRNAYGKILGLALALTFGIWLRDVNCGIKIFKRRIWPAIRPVHGVEKLFNAELFLNLRKNGIPWYAVNVPHYPRKAGNPTGAKLSVILRMFREMFALRRASRNAL